MPDYHIDYYKSLPSLYHTSVYDLLEACESEFVPPLSQRSSTHQSDLLPQEIGAKTPHFDTTRRVSAQKYYDEMLCQQFLLACAGNGRLLAFLSFIPGFNLPSNVLAYPSAYVSTICTAHDSRGKGVARALYDRLEIIAIDKAISLRTWSTNTAQIHLLNSLRYHEVLRIPNDRGVGIDTVYFAKERQNA